MSRAVLTPLLIAAGAVGLPVVLGVTQCARTADRREAAQPETVNAETVYPNNHFLPGAGYYHAPYHGWFLLPFNHYESGRGWYRGGGWRNAAQEDEVEQRALARTGGSVPRGGGGSAGAGAGVSAFARQQSSQPSAEAVQRANAGAKAKAGPVIRGGFGHSSRPSIS
ncbi:MAG: hypothetical protein H7343_02350 [Undibacterium sp.]|nr:hypothetical protein [Opitutaceae bacterium]